MHIYVCVCVHLHRGQRRTLKALLDHSLPYSLKIESLTKTRAKTGGQQTPAFLLFLTLHSHTPNWGYKYIKPHSASYTDARDLNPDPRA